MGKTRYRGGQWSGAPGLVWWQVRRRDRHAADGTSIDSVRRPAKSGPGTGTGPRRRALREGEAERCSRTLVIGRAAQCVAYRRMAPSAGIFPEHRPACRCRRNRGFRAGTAAMRVSGKQHARHAASPAPVFRTRASEGAVLRVHRLRARPGRPQPSRIGPPSTQCPASPIGRANSAPSRSVCNVASAGIIGRGHGSGSPPAAAPPASASKSSFSA